jgi:serine/threonine-protein kinase
MLESSFLAPGNILENRYQLVRELGRGGFGRTYLAEDLNKFREKCVLKEFAPQVKGAQELKKAKELFEREAEVLYKLKHPQIPAFRELFRVHGSSGESLFLVQDYVDGINYCDLLNERIKQGQVFSEEEVIQLLRNLLPVLDYIHSLDVIHRDISPDNIIYRHRDKMPVLIDFGGVKEIAATAVSRYTQAPVATRIGKQGYAPDEQMMRGKVSPSSDLYALAATALTLLTGKPAPEIYNTAEAKWEWRKYTHLGDELATILDRMLQYHAQNRYQSAQEVLAVLPKHHHHSPTPPVNKTPTNNSTHANEIARPNLVSKLKTLIISPQKSANITTPEPPDRDPNEWKKPAWQVTKVMGTIFVTCWGISAVVKWVQAIDPIGAITNSMNNTAKSIETSIPKPFKKSPSSPSSPSQPQKQADLNQRLQELNITKSTFYRQVNREFYAKHPELKNRPLTNSPEDAKLRQEWQDIAHQLLDKQSR